MRPIAARRIPNGDRKSSNREKAHADHALHGESPMGIERVLVVPDYAQLTVVAGRIPNGDRNPIDDHEEPPPPGGENPQWGSKANRGCAYLKALMLRYFVVIGSSATISCKILGAFPPLLDAAMLSATTKGPSAICATA